MALYPLKIASNGVQLSAILYSFHILFSSCDLDINIVNMYIMNGFLLFTSKLSRLYLLYDVIKYFAVQPNGLYGFLLVYKCHIARDIA